MSIKRWATKRDENEKAVVKALRSMGASVTHLDQPCDLLIGFRGVTRLADVKSDKGKLTKPQEKFVSEWRGSEMLIIRSQDDAIKAINQEF